MWMWRSLPSASPSDARRLGGATAGRDCFTEPHHQLLLGVLLMTDVKDVFKHHFKGFVNECFSFFFCFSSDI